MELWRAATRVQPEARRVRCEAYPALVDQKDSVAIQLVEAGGAAAADVGRPAPAGAAQRAIPIKYLQEKLPNKAKLGLYFNPFGKVAGAYRRLYRLWFATS